MSDNNSNSMIAEKTVTNKYKVGQKLWFIEGMKAISKPVHLIVNRRNSIYYGFESYGYSERLSESNLIPEENAFASKDSLLKSL